MAKYRKKPVVIEAFQFKGDPRYATCPIYQPHWFTEAIRDGRAVFHGADDPHWLLQTLEGPLRASIGDWIIQGVKGELYPCKPDVFVATYELAPSESSDYESFAAMRMRSYES